MVWEDKWGEGGMLQIHSPDHWLNAQYDDNELAEDGVKSTNQKCPLLTFYVVLSQQKFPCDGRQKNENKN